MINSAKALDVLKNNLLPSFGCTDPITPALAAAIAYREARRGEVLSIDITVSNDVYKGAYSVVIPGTREKGIEFAVALGIACGDPERGLMALENCNDESIARAYEILKSTKINIIQDSTKGKIYVELSMVTSSGSSKVIFNGRHEKYCYLEANNARKDAYNPGEALERNLLEEIPESIDTLCSLVEKFSESDLDFINEGIIMNKTASKTGLKKSYGMNIAKHLEDTFSDGAPLGYMSAKIYASAAGDARMGGCNQAVISVFGSGNQGILIFNTINDFGINCGIEHLRILRAISLSCLLAGQFNRELSEGTPFCKCAVVASAAVAGGIAYMLGGTLIQIENAIQMTTSCFAGLICDGAKPNCSLKISIGAGTAIENALMALKFNVPIPSDGILASRYLDSIRNLFRIGRIVKEPIEEEIITILKGKSNRFINLKY